jgi:hypothetical protein
MYRADSIFVNSVFSYCPFCAPILGCQMWPYAAKSCVRCVHQYISIGKKDNVTRWILACKSDTQSYQNLSACQLPYITRIRHPAMLA